MGELDAGIFQLAMERGDRDYVLQNYTDLKNLSITSGRPITFGSLSRRESPGLWRDCYDIIEKGNLEGARLFTQVHSREINSVMSFETHLPFDNWDVWRDIRALPLDQQKAALRDPETKKKLIEIASRPYQGPAVIGGEARPPEWNMFYVMESEKWAHRTMADIARERGVVPAEAMIDMALEHDLKLFFRQPIANENMDDALDLMKHPHSCVTFSDSGAHVSQIMDSSLQTHLLSHWVRDKQAFTLEEAVRLVTYDTATQWGFHDRGLIREGMTADMVVFNPDTIGPRMPEVVSDLPAGAKRLRQTAHGIANTIVGGQTVLRNGEHTGALPGKLLRGQLAQA